METNVEIVYDEISVDSEKNADYLADEKLAKEERSIVWRNVVLITIWHLVSIYAIFAYTFRIKFLTFIWLFIVVYMGGFGITAGVHRLWSHRTYKAKLPLQIIFLILFTISGQNTVLEWVRNHRVHHKFSDTDADPHNSKRGFFFSHVGWLMQKKHPEVIRKGKLIDTSDITGDPLLMFHTKYFTYFKILFCFILPTIIPVYYWNEQWKYAILSQCFVRYMLTMNFTWSVNSFAHMWGYKPYDKRIMPVENFYVSIVALGEGWHNYHHVFPWDYRTAELGAYRLNLTTLLLDMFAKIGWAYDMKVPSEELVRKVMTKNGDGSRRIEEIPEHFNSNRVFDEKPE